MQFISTFVHVDEQTQVRVHVIVDPTRPSLETIVDDFRH